VATPECAAVARAAIHLAPEAATLVLIGEPEAPGSDEPGVPTGIQVRAWADLLAAGQAAGPAAPYRTWFDSPACREGLASFKRPREVLALDALPKTATGKIQRGVVRDVVAQRPGKAGG
jgi:acyl-CoA synthetase (AMP-forming)/AMP-acid ligase II